MPAEPRWWLVRPAQNRKPTTYRCPFCSQPIHPMVPHALIAPEGDLSRRRHAHVECVRRAQLNTTKPREPKRRYRLFGRAADRER